VNREDTILSGEELGRSAAEAAASLPGAAGTAGAVVGHLLKFSVLVRRQHRFEGIVTGRHESLQLSSFFLRQEIVILMDGLGLAAEVILAGFQFGYLVISEIEGLAEPFEAGAGHELGFVIAEPMAGGLLIFLQRGQKGLQFGFLFLLQGDKAGLILFQGNIVLFEEVRGLLAVFFVDRHGLLALFGGVMDEFVATATKTVVTEAVVTEVVVTRTMEGVAIAAAEGAGVAVETVVSGETVRTTGTMEAVAVGCAMETVMGYMGCVLGRVVARGLGVCGPTEDQGSEK
jgi:hypothetical protein